MKRSRLSRSTPLSRSPGPRQSGELKRTTRIKPVNRKRKTKRLAEDFGPQANHCRALPCCVCSRPPPSDPAHVRSRGAGGKGRGNIVPLCRHHHQEQGDHGIKTFQAKYGIDLAKLALEIESQVIFPED